MDDEQVPLYGVDGRPTGEVAPRQAVRARNLHHAATAVVVRDSRGRVYVHRRTTTKDVYPGLHDLAAGGVLVVGEEPYAAALREVDEELGVRDVDLVALGEADYTDAHTSYRAFCFTCTYDGPITHQASEVAWGAWVTLAELRVMLREEPFVPDTVALLGGWLEELGRE